MKELGATHLMSDKEFNENNTIGYHKLDIIISKPYKICYNPMKRCWVGFGRKLLLDEHKAKQYAAKVKLMLGLS